MVAAGRKGGERKRRGVLLYKDTGGYSGFCIRIPVKGAPTEFINIYYIITYTNIKTPVF